MRQPEDARPGLGTTNRPLTTSACRGTERRTDIACRRMPNGRSHVGQARLALDMATWTRSLDTRRTPTSPCPRLERRRPTRGGCSTPWVACGSGAGTSTTWRCTGRTASSAAAAGAIRTGAVGLASVARPAPRLRSTTWVSASPERSPPDGSRRRGASRPTTMLVAFTVRSRHPDGAVNRSV